MESSAFAAVTVLDASVDPMGKYCAILAEKRRQHSLKAHLPAAFSSLPHKGTGRRDALALLCRGYVLFFERPISVLADNLGEYERSLAPRYDVSSAFRAAPITLDNLVTVLPEKVRSRVLSPYLEQRGFVLNVHASPFIR